MSPSRRVLAASIVVLVFAPLARGQDCQTQNSILVQKGPPAIIHGDSGSAVLQVQNPQSSPANLELSPATLG